MNTINVVYWPLTWFHHHKHTARKLVIKFKIFTISPTPYNLNPTKTLITMHEQLKNKIEPPHWLELTVNIVSYTTIVTISMCGITHNLSPWVFIVKYAYVFERSTYECVSQWHTIHQTH